MKRVLLTGGCGFVGRHAAAGLAARGFEVHVVDIREPAAGVLPEGAVFHASDLLNTDAMRRLVGQTSPTHLLHLAWTTAHGKFWTADENMDWLRAGVELTRRFVAEGGQRMVGAGTCAEYDWNSGICSEETTPIKPATLYGHCKNSLQQAAAAFCRQKGVSFGWGRTFFLYGPAEDPRRLIPYVITSLLKGETANCTHGRQVRDYIHVADAGAAFAAFLDSAVEGPVNIASGRPRMLREITEIISIFTGNSHLLHMGAVEASPGDSMLIAAETRRLTDEVGFVPPTGLEIGIKETVEWWKRQL
jgi:nucleoside-diphosphate-sugar epimerase